MPEAILQILLEIVERIPWSSVENKLEHVNTLREHLQAAQAGQAPEAETPEGGAQ